MTLIHLLFILILPSVLTFNTDGDKMSHEQGGDQWPEAQVPFKLDGNFSASFHDSFIQALNEIHEKTCIRFRARTSLDHYFLRIHIGDGCWSYVGMMPELAAVGQPLSLGHECQSKGVILHELILTLGVSRKHTRYDRDKHVVLNAQNIDSEHATQFHRRTRHKTDQAIPYNLRSTVHYQESAFAVDPALPTIVSQSLVSSQTRIGHQKALNSRDVQEINRLYNCTTFESSIVEVANAIETGIPLTNHNNAVLDEPPRSRKNSRPKSYYWFRSPNDFKRRTGKFAPSWLQFATFADDAQEFPRAVQCATTGESNCQDRSTDCLEWALRGECKRKPGHMLRICRRSCCNCDDSKCYDTNDEAKFRTLCLGRFRHPITRAQVSACELKVTRRNAIDFCPRSCNDCFTKPVE